MLPNLRRKFKSIQAAFASTSASAESELNASMGVNAVVSSPSNDAVAVNQSTLAETAGALESKAARTLSQRVAAALRSFTQVSAVLMGALPQPCDITHDNVRSRALSLATFCLLYFMLVFSLLNPPQATSSSVLELLSCSLPPEVFSSSFAAPAVRFPVFLVLQNGVPVAGVRVCVAATVSTANAVPGTSVGLACGNSNVQFFGSSLLGLSLETTCRVDMVGNCSVSDAAGLANFSSLDFSSSPAGFYNLTFATGDASASSGPFVTIISGLQGGSLTLTSIPPSSIVVGEPISPPPVLQVRYNSGAAVPSGVQVRAFVWNSYTGAAAAAINTNVNEYVFGELRGAVAFTDADGVATFSNLRLVGSTCGSLFVNFTVSNTVFGSLSSQSVSGIPIVTRVTSVLVTSPVQLTGINAMEGQPLAPIQAKVLCGAAMACSSRRVYASLDVLNGRGVRKVQFDSFYGQKPKFLLNSTATTDENGNANFPFLAFSVSGEVGQFQISFVCDGTYSNAVLSGTVSSSVTNIKLQSGTIQFGLFPAYNVQLSPGSPVYISYANFSQAPITFSSIIQVVDGNGMPVLGKSVSISLTAFSSPLAPIDFNIQTNPLSSDTLGIISCTLTVLPFINGDVLLSRSSATLVLSVDSVQLMFPLIFGPTNGLMTTTDSSFSNFLTIFQGNVTDASSWSLWSPWSPAKLLSNEPLVLNFIPYSTSPASGPCSISLQVPVSFRLVISIIFHHSLDQVILISVRDVNGNDVTPYVDVVSCQSTSLNL